MKEALHQGDISDAAGEKHKSAYALAGKQLQKRHTHEENLFLPDEKQAEAGLQTVSVEFEKYSHGIILIYNKIW